MILFCRAGAFLTNYLSDLSDVFYNSLIYKVPEAGVEPARGFLPPGF